MNFGQISLLSGSTNKIVLQAQSGVSTDYTLRLPSVAPTNTQQLRWNSTTSAFEWFTPSAGISGISIVSADVNSFTVTDTSGGAGTAFSLAYPSRNQRLFLASPSNGTGIPTFRAIADADITALDASKLTGTIGVALMPNGTNATSWQIGVSALNPKLVASDTNTLAVRKNDNTLADLVVNKITATQVDYTQVNTVEYGDNILRLNADYTGTTPTENAGFEVNRGTQTAYQVVFDESIDRLTAGFVGSLRTVSQTLTRSFTSTDLTGSTLVWAHNTGIDYPVVTVFNSSGTTIGVSYTRNSANQVTIDLSNLTVTGTWQAILVG